MDELSFLENPEQTGTMMKQLQTAAATLKRLEFDMMVAEEEYNKAKAQFLAFATKELPDLFLSQGVNTVALEGGGAITIKTHTKASIKKGKEQSVLDFLRERQAGHLLKERLVVSQNDYEALKKSGIPFEEESNVNTISLKAYVLDEMAQGNLSAEDLPEGLSWYQWQQAEVL